MARNNIVIMKCDRCGNHEAENTRLREALAPFAYAAFGADGYPDEEAFTLVLRPDAEEYDDGDLPERESLITARQLRLARAALNKGGPYVEHMAERPLRHLSSASPDAARLAAVELAAVGALEPQSLSGGAAGQ